MNNSKPNILVVCSKDRDHLALSHLSNYNFFYLDMKYSARFNKFDFDVLKYMNKARKIIDEQNINGIIYSFDLGALIASVLTKEYNLPGPDLHNVFQCYHKYYTQKATGNLTNTKILYLDQDIVVKKYPKYVKVPCSAAGVLGFTVNNKNELKKAIELIRKELPIMNEPLIPFYDEFLYYCHFKFANKNVFLIENYKSGDQMTIEGFVYQGEVNITLITDTNNFRGTRLIDNFSLPSKISNKIQMKLTNRAIRDIKAVGLGNSFFNIEYFYTEESIELIEINPRAATCFYNLYRESYGYDVYLNMVELSLGKKPKVSIKYKQVGGQFNILTKKEGDSSKILNYTAKIPVFHTIFVPNNTQIIQKSEYGIVILQLELFGESYPEIKKKADEYRKKLLL